MKKSRRWIGILLVLLTLTGCGNKSIEDTEGSDLQEGVIDNIEDGMIQEEDAQSLEESILQEKEAEKEAEKEEKKTQKEEGIDVDLTILSSTMMYAEVFSMYTTPDAYKNKIVKVEGAFGAEKSPIEDKIYFSVMVADEQQCCAQNIEFELAGEHVYPEDYPTAGEVITVVGEFDTYYEDTLMYCVLRNATIRS